MNFSSLRDFLTNFYSRKFFDIHLQSLFYQNTSLFFIFLKVEQAYFFPLIQFLERINNPFIFRYSEHTIVIVLENVTILKAKLTTLKMIKMNKVRKIPVKVKLFRNSRKEEFRNFIKRVDKNI